MLAAILAFTLLASVCSAPLDENPIDQPQPAVAQPESLKTPESLLTPQILPNIPVPDGIAPQDGASNENRFIPPESGAVPPSDVAQSPDAAPVDRTGTSDLDTDATFWGGYGGYGYRPYYGGGWGGYYSNPWRRWGGYGWGGRGYGGYGGWGWGGRGWGGRGWGWGGRYWG